jgi:hypothetical protein
MNLLTEGIDNNISFPRIQDHNPLSVLTIFFDAYLDQPE